MKKSYIFSPGPVAVPPEVLLAGAQPTVHHRSADFPPIFKRCEEKLQKIFLTANPVVITASSGTGAVEAAMVSTSSPGDTVVVYNGGKFGERWLKVGQVYGLKVIDLKTEWGKPLDVDLLEKTLKENPNTKSVVVTQTETSTGTVSDIKRIGEIVSATPAISIIDAVSAFAAEEMRTDEWKIDIVCTGSQKAMMLPPGLGFASVSPKAEEAMKTAKCACFYLDLRRYLKAMRGGEDTPFTPAVNLFYSLEKACDMLLEEGIENSWARHKVLSRAARAAMVALGLSLYSEMPSVVLTATNMPEGIEFGAFNKQLKARGITIAGGQDHLKGKIFRFATLGYYDVFDVITIISAIEMALSGAGYKFETGKGVSAALEILSQYNPAKGWVAAEEATRNLEPVAALL
ncbi:MAG: alanine--glyoxylate aminotransferase family protein [Candidatus Sumerlaeota bacterium]